MLGLKVLQTVDGRPVHQVSKGVYQIVDTSHDPRCLGRP
jgi:hypothetical protein